MENREGHVEKFEDKSYMYDLIKLKLMSDAFFELLDKNPELKEKFRQKIESEIKERL